MLELINVSFAVDGEEGKKEIAEENEAVSFDEMSDMESLVYALDGGLYEVLSALYSLGREEALIKARSGGMLLEGAVDKINSLAFDHIGDILIDEGFVIPEDYREELGEALNKRSKL